MTDDVIASTAAPSAFRRISWGAVWAGAFIVVAVQLMLSILGIGVGASTINVGQGSGPGEGLGIGAAIWFAVSAWIALYLGSWVAGKLAGVPRNRDGALHGFVTWAVATLALFFLLTTAVGDVLGGTASIIKGTASVAGHAAPAVAGVVSDITGVTPQEVKQEAADVANDPQFQAFVKDVVQNGTVTPDDRQALVNVVAQHRNISQQQASNVVSGWEQSLQNAAQQAKTTGTQVANAAASGTAKFGIWTFVMLIVGLFVACWGGAVGAPENSTLIPLARTRRVP